jgi:hypothetical protein
MLGMLVVASVIGLVLGIIILGELSDSASGGGTTHAARWWNSMDPSYRNRWFRPRSSATPPMGDL